MGGVLYITATPLGNLDDLTFRAARALKNVSLVAAEDTRRTRKLLSHLGASVRLVSYREQNHKRAAAEILDCLSQGQDAALVSDAGTPGVSDPGAWLVREAAAAGFTVLPLPGPSAVAAAVSVSGFEGEGFVFAGFLPAKEKARRRRIEELRLLSSPLVFFETPHRLQAGLTDLLEVLGDRPALLCREMTKLNEEYIRGSLSEIAAWSTSRPDKVRGEATLVVAGASAEDGILLTREELIEVIREDDGPVKEIAARLAKTTNLTRSELYRLALEVRGKKDEIAT